MPMFFVESKNASSAQISVVVGSLDCRPVAKRLADLVAGGLFSFSAAAFSAFFARAGEATGAAATCPCECGVVALAINKMHTANFFIRSCLVFLPNAIGQ